MGPMWMLYLGINLIGLGGFMLLHTWEQYQKHKKEEENPVKT